MTTLGQTLASNIDTEIKNTVPPNVIAEQKHQDEVREINARGERFFAKAKDFFAGGIRKGIPYADLRLQVGEGGYEAKVDTHMDIYHQLDWVYVNGARRWYSGNAIPASLTDPDRFAASWDDFVDWAAANGLEPYWESIPLTYGVHNLRIRPAPAVVAKFPKHDGASEQPREDEPIGWYRLAKINAGGKEDPGGKYTGKIFEANPHVVRFGQYNWRPLFGRSVAATTAALQDAAQRLVEIYEDKTNSCLVIDNAVANLERALAASKAEPGSKT
jgi:hypothetical protein